MNPDQFTPQQRRALQAWIPRLMAEEQLEGFFNARQDYKDRYRDLITAKTGDAEYGEKVWRELVMREQEARLDG